MPLKLVTDPELLKQLNSEEPSQPQQKPLRLVTDPELLRQLNEEEPQESYGEKLKAAPGKIASDLGDLIFQRIRDIPNYLEKSKTEIPGFVESYFKHPVSMLRQEVAGGNEAINALAQTPLNIAKYGSNRLGLIPQSAKNALEKITPEDTTQAINQVFGQPQYPGEALARGVTRNLPMIAPGISLAKNILSYAAPSNIKKALKSTKGLENQLIQVEQEYGIASNIEQQEKNAAIREHGIGNINSLEYRQKEAKNKLDNLTSNLNINPPKTPDEYIKSQNELSRLTQEYENARAAAIKEVGLSDVNRIQYKINEKQKKLDQLINDARNGKQISDEQLNNAINDLNIAKNEFEKNKTYAESNFGTSKENSLQLKINNNNEKVRELNEKLATQKEPEFPLNEKNKTFERKKIPNISEYAENEKKATAYYENAENNVSKVENEIAHHVNENADHAVRASREMKHEIESINKYWSDDYKTLVNKLKSNKFNLVNKDRLPEIKNEIMKLRSSEIIKGNNEFNQLMQKAPTAKDISASDFMTRQKDFRDARYDLLKRAREESSAVKRRELFEAYDASAGIDKIINQTLEQGLGDYLPEYRRINEGYKTQVFPLRENPVSNKIMEGKPMSSNIAHELAGDQEGQALLREIASRNNEVKRNIMGQQYKKSAKDKSGFYNPDETVREYLNKMPELNKLIDKRDNTVSYTNEAKSNLDKSKELHNKAKERNIQIEKENESITKEQEKYNIAKEKEKEYTRLAKEKETTRISKEKEQYFKEIKALQEKNSLLGGIKTKLAETTENKNKIEIYHKELNEIKNHQDNTHKSINEINDSIKILDKHLNAIKRTKEQLKGIIKPEKITISKAPDVQNIKQQINNITKKIFNLDVNIKKLKEASKNTELKLSKKIEIEKSLNEANIMKKEARRKLKIVGYAIAGMTGIKLYPNLKNYILNTKNNESME